MDEGRDDASADAADSAEHAADPRGESSLLSRLAVIEDQAIESRAEAYTNMHDELLRRLESADQPSDA